MPIQDVPNDIRSEYLEKARRLKAQGKPVPYLTYKGETYFADNKNTVENPVYRLRSTKGKRKTGNNRRASKKQKTITVDERELWYKRNFERIPEGMTAREIALQDQADNERVRAEQAAEAARRGDVAYEHVSPLNAPEKFGGFEDMYNIDLFDKTPNLQKSDKVASPKVLREQGVPLSRAEAIRKQANKVPVPTADGSRSEAALSDIKTNKRPKANKLAETLKILGKAF